MSIWQNKNVIFPLLLFLVGLALCESYWQDGSFWDGTQWIKWDDSWKTWTNSTECASCEEYMYYDSMTNKWAYCADGEYYDNTYQVWRNWDGKWTGNWKYQRQWFEWSEHQILDLESILCVYNCDLPKFVLEGYQYSLSKIWRSLEYYVNPQSSEMVELGTITYPYRSFRAVASEILNNFSHQNVNITIYF